MPRIIPNFAFNINSLAFSLFLRIVMLQNEIDVRRTKRVGR